MIEVFGISKKARVADPIKALAFPQKPPMDVLIISCEEFWRAYRVTEVKEIAKSNIGLLECESFSFSAAFASGI